VEVLLVLDGGAKQVGDPTYRERFGTNEFCAYRAAAHLASIAQEGGAIRKLSVAVAFAMMEIESWAIGVIDQMGGIDLGGEVVIPEGLTPPDDPEGRRDAKQWLKQHIAYKPALHQKTLLGNLPLKLALETSHSFRHLDKAVRELANACRTGTRICSPSMA